MKAFFLSLRKFLLLGLITCAFITFFYLHLYRYLTINTIKLYQGEVQTWTLTHYNEAVTLYILIFVGLVACAIPCATFLTLMGGFLFGTIALLYSMFCITFGGMLLFLAIRTAIGSRIAVQSTGWFKKMESGFREDAFNYLLSIRLVPIFPCWISNIGAGLLNVPLKTFLIATTVGILPSTFIYVMAGRSLDTLLTDKSVPLLNIVFTPSVFLPLLGLAILSLVPVFYKFFKRTAK